MPEQNAAEPSLTSATKVALDAFANGLARIGYGSASLPEGASYPLTRFTRNYILMQSLYRSNWIARKIIDCPAEDMMKKFPKLKCQVTPQQDDQFQRVVRKTDTLGKTMKALKWGALFGGAVAIPVIKGQGDILDQPLDLDSIPIDSYRGLLVFDRWSGVTPNADVCDDIDMPLDFGLPVSYQISTEKGQTFNIHHSRVLRFTGRGLPEWEFQAESRWGMSEYELVFEELKKRDNTSWSIVNLMFRANVMAIKMPQLAQQLAMPNTPAFNNGLQALQAQNELMSSQRLMVLPADASLEDHQYSFGGIADVYAQFMLDTCGASEMSMSKLFGRSATGLSASTGDDNLMYEQTLEQKRNTRLSPVMDRLFPIIAMSTWGRVPDDLDYSYPPIREMGDKDRADLAKVVGDTVVSVYNAGIGSQQLALMELKASSDITGMWTNITDEMIKAANTEVIQPDMPGAAEEGENDDDGKDSAED